MESDNKRNNKKRRVILISCIIAALCILVGISSYAFINRPTPEGVLAKYMSYINSKNYEKMYDLISEGSKEGISKEEFINRNKKIYEGIESKNLKVTIKNVIDHNGSKTVDYDTSMETIAGHLNFNNKAILNKNRIEWNSSVIFPELLNDDKVKVNSINGKRGSILDRNGTVLAGNGKVASVGLVPGKMNKSSLEDIKKIAEILSMPEDTINKKLSESYVKPDSFVPLKSIGEKDTKIKETLLKIPGIMISRVDARVYPLGEAASHLTGYVQNISGEELKNLKGKSYDAGSIIGKIGVEKLLENKLHEENGHRISIADKNGKNKKTLAEKAPENGEDIKLTIDASIQSKLYNQLKNDKSSSVVMNKSTGEILALVSTPSYDPNEFVLGMSSNRWQELNNNENKPMYNRFKAALTPGSSLKPIIGAIGLTTGTITHDENFGHSGLSWKKDESWGKYEVTTLKDYGNNVVMRNALIYSDNIYFAKAALKIGGDTLAKQLLNMGFSEEIPFEFGLTKSQFGKDNKFSTEVQLADSGYGQGQVLVNPVHMASMYTALLNEGNMIKPYLVYKESGPEILKKQVFSQAAANTVRDDLIKVVEDPNGTGHSAKINGITIGGKTGTAEIKASKDDKSGTELGWFVAFTADKNSDKPYLALTMVEDVKSRGGSHYVIPIVKSVFEK